MGHGSASRRCGECQRITKGTAPRCVWCGAALPSLEEAAREASDEMREATLSSPRAAGVTLVPIEIEGLLLHRCPETRGLWLSGAVFEHLVERQMSSAQTDRLASQLRLARGVERGKMWETAGGFLRCPVCDEHMTRRNFKGVSGVVYDECVLHGVWLDDHELEEILRFIATGGLVYSRSVQTQQAAAEAAHRETVDDWTGDVRATGGGDHAVPRTTLGRLLWFFR